MHTGITKTHITAACLVGIVGGLFVTLSPITVYFGLAMVALFVWAGRGLEGRERAWVFGLLGAALLLRVLALALFFFLARRFDGPFPVLVPDEAHLAFRSRLLRLMALDIPLAGLDYAESAAQYGQSGLHYVHAYLQFFVGEARYAIRFFDVALYLASCVALYRIVRPAFGALAALGGFAVVLFTPSLFIWSVAFLKETPSQFLTVVGVGAAVVAARARLLGVRIFACLLIVGVVMTVESVRPGGAIMVGGGIATGLLSATLIRRPLWMAVALMACLAAGIVGLKSSGVQERAKNLLAQIAVSHLGYVHTAGWNYKLLDPEFYMREREGQPLGIDPSRLTTAATARYAIRAIVSFFFVPFPGNAASPPILAYLPEQLIWDLLVVLALVGAVAGFRVDATVTLVLVGFIALGALLIGMSSGNIGTLIRHRSMIAILVPWLSSLGACEVLAWVARHTGARRNADAVLRERGMSAVY